VQRCGLTSVWLAVSQTLLLAVGECRLLNQSFSLGYVRRRFEERLQRLVVVDLRIEVRILGQDGIALVEQQCVVPSIVVFHGAGWYWCAWLVNGDYLVACEV
jgi:hypothetical protein